MGAVDFIKGMFRQKDAYAGQSMAQVLGLGSNTAELGRMTQSNMDKYLSKYADQAWIFACIRVIQTKGAGVPIKIYRKNGEKMVELPEHPVKLLLDSVNPFMNGYDLFESTHGYIELVGNSYWLLDAFVDEKPTEIYPLNPKCIKIMASKEGGVTGYAYEIMPGKVEKVFSPDEIVHFKNWNPQDPFYGMAPLCAARDSADTILFSDQYNKAFFKNGAEPGGILTTDQGITEDSKKAINSAWSKLHQGVRKAHKLAILDNGLKWQSMGTTHKDMDYSELKRMSREDVLTVFNMQPVMVGLHGDSNYSNAREQRRSFWIDCMVPRLRKIESVINERLVKKFDPSLIAKFDLNGIEDLAEDADKRSRADSINVSSGIVLVNEIRKEKNLPPVPWGDTWWAPMGLSPVDPVTGKPEEPETSSEPITPEDPEDEPSEPENDTPAKTVKSDVSPIPEPIQEDVQKVRRDHIWVRYKGMTERIEKRWAGQMRQLFTDQEREVIANVQNADWQKAIQQNKLDKMRHVKNTLDIILFDRTKARTIFRREAHRLMSYTIGQAADSEIDQYNLGIDFNLTDPNVTSWINSKSFKFSEEVNRTTEDALRDELTQAIANGETISQVEDRIASVFDIARGSRTAMIARTEVISASNEGAMESYKQSGVVEKVEWISSRDSLVRDTHQIDGEQVNLGMDFSNGLKFPGDPAGEASNVINCRCTVGPIVSKED
jgi:HK97 family phage portal protein